MDSHDHTPDNQRDPMLRLSFKQLATLSRKEYRFLKMQQNAYRRQQRDLKREARNAKIEAQQAKRQERNAKFERPRDPDAAARYEADRQRAKQARFAELEARADAVFANYNEGDE